MHACVGWRGYINVQNSLVIMLAWIPSLMHVVRIMRLTYHPPFSGVSTSSCI